MIVAKFSNGKTDVYKGSRPVKAGWMVTLPDGSTRSGHSLDRAKADKTARGAISQACPFGMLGMIGGRGGRFQGVTPASAQYFMKVATDAGFKNYRAYNDAMKIKRAEWSAKCKVEVVDLQGEGG